MPWSLSSPPQSSSSGVVSDRCDLTWRDELQAQTNTLLHQFPGLTLLDAVFWRSRQTKIARIFVSAAHDRRLLSIFNARDILCNANRSLLWRYVWPCPLSTTSGWNYNGCYFDLDFSRNYRNKNSCEQYNPRFKNSQYFAWQPPLTDTWWQQYTASLYCFLAASHLLACRHTGMCAKCVLVSVLYWHMVCHVTYT